jgi:hypothetical protein
MVEESRDSRSLKRSASARLFRSAARFLVPWTLSTFLALSLFTTFSYRPPDLPTNHPHIVRNEFTVQQLAVEEESSDLRSAQRLSNNATATMEPFSWGQVDLASLHLPINATTIILNQVPKSHPMQQNPILSALRDAAVEEIPVDDWKELPKLAEHLKNLYGPRILSRQEDGPNSGPVVFGMETCPDYRASVPLQERYIGPAGMFNTGTNALEHHLRTNILKVAAVWQIPWGKQLPYHTIICLFQLTLT